MNNAQLALLFLCGFLLSRLLVKVRVPEHLVDRLFHRELSVARIVLYLVALSALLSVFIPNAVTAIALIPVVVLIRRKLVEQHLGSHTAVTTALALSIIYGANIGGMASITATPANGLLVAYAALRDTPDQGVLRFDGWLLWGIPLTVVLVLVSCVSGVRWSAKATALNGLPTAHPEALGVASRMTLAFLSASVMLSAAMHASSEGVWVLVLTALLAAGFVWVLFRPRQPAPLLTWNDCFAKLPLSGLKVVAIIVILAVLGGLFGAIEYGATAATSVLPDDLDNLSAFAWVAVLTTFTTQLMTNTVVQLAMFETLNAHPDTGGGLIYLLLVVTLSSTSAFMTPIATGVNGLVYGELEGTSLGRMLFAGVVMNVVTDVVIAACVFFVVVAL
jgi:sodium-dependent dicarboxylate transporter 2/3/5